jgi:hypothetical protein
MTASRLDIFLLHDSPELEPMIKAFSERLRDYPGLDIEPISLTSRVDSHQSGIGHRKDLREGDVLVFFTKDTSDTFNESFVRAYCERAQSRQLVVVPIIPKSNREPRRPAWRRSLVETFIPISLDYSLPSAELAEKAASAIFPQLHLASRGTDLMVKPLSGEQSPDALDLLEPPEKDSQSNAAMAIKAMDARLLITAIDCLKNASHEHAASSIFPYWSARIRLATNAREQTTKALIEATRSARLSLLEEASEEFTFAAWMLASKAAWLSNDEEAANAYLGEAIKETLNATRLIEVARRQVEIKRHEDAMATLEEAALLDPSIYIESVSSSEFEVLHDRITSLNTTLRERHRVNAAAIIAHEKALIGHLHSHKTPPLNTRAQDCSDIPTLSGSDFRQIIEHGKQSAQRQLDLLSSWALALTEKAQRHISVLRQLQRIPEKPPERPKTAGWNALLLRVWPPFKRQHEALLLVIEEQEKKRALLLSEDQRLSEDLTTNVEALLQSVSKFESIILKDPLFASIKDLSEASDGDLILYPNNHDMHQKVALDSESLPKLLRSYAPSLNPPEDQPQLCRIERNQIDGNLAASRAGVYFQQAWESLKASTLKPVF